jgi:YVTN family beta-propeller protein
VPGSSNDAVTFLFTDIEGSTRLLDRLGDEYGHVLAQHQRLLRAAFAAYGGKEVDTQGDAFFVTFRSPDDAVHAAIDGQRALAGCEWPQGVTVRVRIGMDTGRAAVMAERYTGHAVHRAARISAAGHGGQILLSEASVEELGDVRDEFGLRDLGRRRLKDIAGRVRIYQVEAPALERRFPQLKTLDIVHRRRRRMIAVLAAVAVAIGVAFAYVLSRPSPVTIPSNSVGTISPRTRRLVAPIQVGSLPSAVSFGSGSVWVANKGDQTLSQIDPFTKAVVRTVRLGGLTPDAVAAVPGAVWVLNSVSGSLLRIDPDVGRVAQRIQATGSFSPAGAGGGVAVGGGSVWAVSSSSTLVRLDPSGGHVVRSFAGRNPRGLAFGAGALWVANRSENDVYRFDPKRFGRPAFGPISACGRRLSGRCSIAVGRGPSAITFGGGYVWVADTDDDAVTRIDPRTNATTSTKVGDSPGGVAFGSGAVWVANAGDGTVSRIDPNSLEVKTVDVGHSPAGVTFGEKLVWVTVDPGSGR